MKLKSIEIRVYYYYDQRIIEKSIGLVIGPFTAMFKYYPLTNNAMGLQDGYCPNLRRGGNVPSFIPSDC